LLVPDYNIKYNCINISDNYYNTKVEVRTLLIIGIAGGTGAGKTTVARAIADRLGYENVTYLSQDSYYRDHSHMKIEERAKLNLDHPDAFDNTLLLSHLEQLRAGNSIDVPVYDYFIHSRTTKTTLMPARQVVILEGILVLAVPEILSILDVKVFVDADPDIRVIRRLERDIKERGSNMESSINRYISTVKPMHEAFVEPSKRHADIIVPRGGQNEIAINLLSALVESHLPNNMKCACPPDNN
jgi:uridine kinase